MKSKPERDSEIRDHRYVTRGAEAKRRAVDDASGAHARRTTSCVRSIMGRGRACRRRRCTGRRCCCRIGEAIAAGRPTLFSPVLLPVELMGTAKQLAAPKSHAASAARADFATAKVHCIACASPRPLSCTHSSFLQGDVNLEEGETIDDVSWRSVFVPICNSAVFFVQIALETNAMRFWKGLCLYR
jgi:hypothetical protein